MGAGAAQGGSYGGYMTLAGATFSDRFATAIAQFGFIDNRQMSLITGDYTCERESDFPRTRAR